MRRSAFPIGVVVVSLLVAVPANADLTGDTVDGSLVFTPTAPGGFSVSAVVGNGIEFQGFLAGPPNQNSFADLTANTVTVGFTGNPGTTGGFGFGNAGTWRFEDLDWLPIAGTVTGLTFQSATPMGSFSPQTTGWIDDPSTWTLTHGTDWIQMEGGVSFQFAFASTLQEISATFLIETDHAVIPAPGAALLAMLGLPMIGWVRRRSA